MTDQTGHVLILNFDTPEIKDAFIGWFLDGGGEQQLFQTCEDNGIVPQGKWIGTSWTNISEQINVVLNDDGSEAGNE